MTPADKTGFFQEGPISPALIAAAIGTLSAKTDVGAHSLFLGQVRNDLIDGKQVSAIDYSTYTELAEETLAAICLEMSDRHGLRHIQITHSLGRVAAGEICMLVLVGSKHRRSAIDACSELVEQIKHKVPIWGKEVFADDTYCWKVNT